MRSAFEGRWTVVGFAHSCTANTSEAKVAKAETKVEKVQQKYDAERLKEQRFQQHLRKPGTLRFCVCRCCCGVWFAAFAAFPHGCLESCHSSSYICPQCVGLAALREVEETFRAEGFWLEKVRGQSVLRWLCALQVVVVFV